MDNHFHLLASTPNANLSDGMAYFMKSTSLDITKAGKRINQTYGGRHFRCVIGSYHYYMNAYKYIYRNPVKAGICRSVEEYRFSSLAGLLGKNRLTFPVLEDNLLFDDPERILKWLNKEPTLADEAAVGNALKQKNFRLCEDKNNRKPNRLESELL